MITEEQRNRMEEVKERLKKQYDIKPLPETSESDLSDSPEKNRHGEPKLPPGQHTARTWPVLDLGEHPKIDTENWRLELAGACHTPFSMNFEDLLSLEQIRDVSDFHCVTRFSVMDMEWEGVRFLDVAALSDPLSEATHILCHGLDGYSTNLPLAEALQEEVLLVHRWRESPLPTEHGGPVRMITPSLYAWKGAKWIHKIEFLTRDKAGYWESRGYSMTANPWREERFG